MPRGRKPHEPTEENRKLVQTLMMSGITEEQTALVLDIDPKTLRKYYRRELDTAKPMAIAKVAKSLFSKATSSNHPQATTAAIFYLKTQGRWHETTRTEHTGPGGAPIQTEQRTQLDVTKLSNDQLLALADILATTSRSPDEGDR